MQVDVDPPHTLKYRIRVAEVELEFAASTVARLLAVLGSTAPFIGLIGTVAGIYLSFTTFATSGAPLSAVAAGVSIALLTAAAGLVCAVLALLLWHDAKLSKEIVAKDRKVTGPTPDQTSHERQFARLDIELSQRFGVVADSRAGGTT